MVGALNDQIHISDPLIIRFIKFFNRMMSSKNPFVSYTGKCSAVFGKGFMKNNLLHIKWKYECDILTMDKIFFLMQSDRGANQLSISYRRLKC